MSRPQPRHPPCQRRPDQQARTAPRSTATNLRQGRPAGQANAPTVVASSTAAGPLSCDAQPQWAPCCQPDGARSDDNATAHLRRTLISSEPQDPPWSVKVLDRTAPLTLSSTGMNEGCAWEPSCGTSTGRWRPAPVSGRRRWSTCSTATLLTMASPGITFDPRCTTGPMAPPRTAAPAPQRPGRVVGPDPPPDRRSARIRGARSRDVVAHTARFRGCSWTPSRGWFMTTPSKH